jgi:hypothetical protein
MISKKDYTTIDRVVRHFAKLPTDNLLAYSYIGPGKINLMHLEDHVVLMDVIKKLANIDKEEE